MNKLNAVFAVAVLAIIFALIGATAQLNNGRAVLSEEIEMKPLYFYERPVEGRVSAVLYSVEEVSEPCSEGIHEGLAVDRYSCIACGWVDQPRYGFTEDDIYLLAQMMCGDAKRDGDGEYDFEWFPVYGKELNQEQINLPLAVVMNRVRSDKFPDTVKEVVIQKGQFTVFPKNLYSTPGEFALEKVREWCEAYDLGEDWVQTIPEDHLYFRSAPGLTNVSR